MYLARVVSGFGRDSEQVWRLLMWSLAQFTMQFRMEVFLSIGSRERCIEVYETVEKLLGTFVSTTTVLRVVDNCEKQATVEVRWGERLSKFNVRRQSHRGSRTLWLMSPDCILYTSSCENLFRNLHLTRLAYLYSYDILRCTSLEQVPPTIREFNFFSIISDGVDAPS